MILVPPVSERPYLPCDGLSEVVRTCLLKWKTMTGTRHEPVIVMELPSDLAYALMEQEVAWPYLRDERVDAALTPALVLAVTTAVSTVVTTRVTEAVVASASRAIRAWLANRGMDDRPALRSARDGSSLVIDAETTEEDIAAYLRRVRGDGEDQADPSSASSLD
ncbi:hypothetical protein ACH41H_47440 [Streptomyces sp. NPDC020800]|uniref:hypothetical protein n=1 Tax=Streptomyces sp. NPDC020800 TaxID=3365092 RepID=UPI003789F2BD